MKKKLTLKEIEEKLHTIEERNHPFLKEIKHDERKGAQKLLDRWYKNLEFRSLAAEKFYEMTALERKLRQEGFSLIAGIDEAGRGPLVGPVVAAAVILP